MTWLIWAVGLSYTFSETDSVFPVMPSVFAKDKISSASVILGYQASMHVDFSACPCVDDDRGCCAFDVGCCHLDDVGFDG